MSSFTFDESGSVAQLPKELGENVTSMLGGAEKAYHLMSCWKRKLGGDPQLAALAQSFAADPVLHRKRQMLFMRYIIGGQAELSAGETLSIGNIATGQEGGNIARDRVRLVHEYLIDAMQEMKVDKASIAGVACLSAEAKQAKVVITGAIQHCAELETAQGSKAPPAGPKRKCSCCALQ